MRTWNGLYFNFYDARNLTATGEYVSTVDSANLAAALVALESALQGWDEPGLASAAGGLWRKMDFAALYDPHKGLLRTGVWVDGSPDADHYGALQSEASLAYLIAIGKGDVPQESWFRL